MIFVTNYNSTAKLPLNGCSLVQCMNTYTKGVSMQNDPSFIVRAQLLRYYCGETIPLSLGYPVGDKDIGVQGILVSKRRAFVGC